jgi:hypothetical protein
MEDLDEPVAAQYNDRTSAAYLVQDRRDDLRGRPLMYARRAVPAGSASAATKTQALGAAW